MNILWRFALPGILFLNFTDSLAQATDSLLLDEVVITSMPFRRVASAVPGSVFILPEAVLTTGNQLDISSYMDQIPGVIMQSAVLNTARLTIRGIGSRTPYSSNRIKAYFEDIPLTSGDGATIIEDLEISEIDRIEVIKGPSSALYGPGLGGTFIIRAGEIPPGFNARVLAETGSFNLFRRGASVSSKNRQSFISGSAYRTTTTGHRQNSNYYRDNLLVRGGTTAGIHSLTLLVNHVNLNARIPSSVDYKTFMNNPSAAAANWLAIDGFQSYKKWQAGISLNSDINETLNNNIALYGIFNDAYESRPFNILDELTQTAGFRQKLTFNRGNHHFSFGSELFSENYRWKIFETLQGDQGDLQSDNIDKRYFFNIFGHYEVEFNNQTIISAGLNLHRLYYNTEDSYNTPTTQQHKYGLVISPRIGLNRSLTDGVSMFVSAGHGFSAPSPEEALLPDGTINRQLKPEEGINIDAGLRSRFFNNRLIADVTFYHIAVKNLLMTRRDAEDIFYGENAGRTHHRGIEGNAVYYFNTSSDIIQHQVSLTYTLMDNRFKHFIQDDIDYRNKKLPGIPGNSLHLGFTSSISNHTRLHGAIRYIGGQYLNDLNTLEYKGHTLAEISAQYNPVTGFFSNFSFRSGVRNIFDTHHASMLLVNAPTFGATPPRYYYPGQPRTWYLGITITY